MIYHETTIKGISISRSGSVKNTVTDKVLKVTKRGYFIHYGKTVNLPKLMLETFRGFNIKTGQLYFIDGNRQNFNIDNLEYKTKLGKIQPPEEPKIISIIKFYFGKSEMINVKDVFKYRMQLKIILEQRNFFDKNKNILNINVFRDYFSIDTPGYKNLSKRNSITINDARRTVYFFLGKLIEDCENDKIVKQ
ncbi:hypothetical protein [Chryseobacterium sp. T20]|uniref:hypothetical protein n=1 Tax=Chryseobacterium sp. T20 TaxID=3395375 RepID=UPI0039BC3E8E